MGGRFLAVKLVRIRLQSAPNALKLTNTYGSHDRTYFRAQMCYFKQVWFAEILAQITGCEKFTGPDRRPHHIITSKPVALTNGAHPHLKHFSRKTANLSHHTHHAPYQMYVIHFFPCWTFSCPNWCCQRFPPFASAFPGAPSVLVDFIWLVTSCVGLQKEEPHTALPHVLYMGASYSR